MIGTQENANIASTFHPYDHDNLPDGWKFLGQGCYRNAFLGPDGVVYKVQHYTEMEGGDDSENVQEWLNFASFGALVYSESQGRCRLAKSHIFRDNNVLAMEYVVRNREAVWYGPNDDWFMAKPIDTETVQRLSFFSKYGMFDDHAENVWYDENDILTMVDYAM